MTHLVVLLTLLAGPTIKGQTLRVYSELQRIDPFGSIAAVDRGSPPREILSPALPRNGYTSFHVAVTAPAKTMYFLAVQSNPADVFRWTIQEEKFVRQGDYWIPDGLVEVRPPFFGIIPDPQAEIAGQTTRVYLLDLWTSKETKPGTVRLEVLIKTADWRVYPMEARIRQVQVPDLPAAAAADPLPAVNLPADASVWQTLESYVEGGAEFTSGPPVTVRAIIQRNAVQDITLARQLENRIGREKIVNQIREAMKDRASGPEWYLKVRDFLYREASLLVP